MASNNLLANLASVSMRQLRDMARRLGVSRYSVQTREGLAKAIVGQSGSEHQEKLTLGQAIGSESAAEVNSANLMALEAEMAPAPRSIAETQVVFLPRDPQWAYVFWEITHADKESAGVAGATQLCLRVADVTGLPGGSSHPHTLQEVVVDSHATEWYLPVPLSDRDYRVELGYRVGGSGGWRSLAFSSVARVPALHPSEQILDQFVPFSLQSPPSSSASPSSNLLTPPPDGPNPGLHERLYQTATARWRSLGRGSEVFHELGDYEAANSSPHASGIGIWASGRSGSGIGGVAARQRSFWLVADAELIVYGATDPAARLTIGGEDVPLSSDGTFTVQMPFRDGQQIYPIEATAADGEQKRKITMEFGRITPDSKVNSREEAIPEWF